jgi:hypothetical protein
MDGSIAATGGQTASRDEGTPLLALGYRCGAPMVRRSGEGMSNVHPEILEVIQRHFPSATGVRVTLTLPDTIGVGEKYFASVTELSDEDRKLVNDHYIRRQAGQMIFRDTADLRRVLRIPE